MDLDGRSEAWTVTCSWLIVTSGGRRRAVLVAVDRDGGVAIPDDLHGDHALGAPVGHMALAAVPVEVGGRITLAKLHLAALSALAGPDHTGQDGQAADEVPNLVPGRLQNLAHLAEDGFLRRIIFHNGRGSIHGQFSPFAGKCTHRITEPSVPGS